MTKRKDKTDEQMEWEGGSYKILPPSKEECEKSTHPYPAWLGAYKPAMNHKSRLVHTGLIKLDDLEEDENAS